VNVATKISLDKFLALPDPQGNFFDTHELREGEIVEEPGPTGEHVEIQERVEALLKSSLPSRYNVLREFYYTLPNQARRADVAVVLKSRREHQRKQVFFGAPDIVIEVLSDSNGAAELSHLRRACLAESCQEFWIVDPFDRVVEAFGKDGRFSAYNADDTAIVHLDADEIQLEISGIFSGTVL